jgi:zinc protease
MWCMRRRTHVWRWNREEGGGLRVEGAAILLLALTSALSPLPSLAQQRSHLEKSITRQVLPNGLEVIAIENHGVPLVTVEIDVRNGAFTQSPQYEGLAHMYEHMFFRANKEYPEPEQFVQALSALGGIFNGTTQEERVNYYVTLPADSIAPGMRLLGDALRDPLFRADELERERQVVLGEYDRNEANPGYHLTTEIGKRLYGAQWSRKNTLGNRDVIAHVTPEQMRVIQHRYYVPNNCALIVAGDITPERVFALAKQTFGDWPRGADPFAADPIPPIPPLTTSDAVIVEQPINTVVVMLQWQGPSVGEDPTSTYAADVFSDVLNLPTSGFQKRLVDSGLWESVGVNYYTLNHTGPITISGQTSPEKLRAALLALDGEISHFGDAGYIDPAALGPVKQQRVVGTLFGLERASGFSHQVGFWWSVANLDYFLSYVDNMAKQTPADLRGYARKYIVGRPRITGVLLSPTARQALRLTPADLAPPKVAQ